MALESFGMIDYYMQPKFRINRKTGLEIVRGVDQNCTDTHTHAHKHNAHKHARTQTRTQKKTHTHTHTEANFISLDFLRKCRNKTKNAL